MFTYLFIYLYDFSVYQNDTIVNNINEGIH